MNIETLEADLERDLSERTTELLFYQNQTQAARSIEDADRLRRALVLLLYAHFEGFAKFAFEAYLLAVNALELSCRDASTTLVAATLQDIFKELRSAHPVRGLFKGQVAEDSTLMRFAREMRFVETAYEILDRKVMIPDTVVQTESNLKIHVLRKLLFRVGLDPALFDEYTGEIEELVNRRNLIAHGADRAGVEEQVYTKLRDSVLKVMAGISREIVEAARNRKYLRSVGIQ